MKTIYFPVTLKQDQQLQGVIKFDVINWAVRGKQQQSKGTFSDPKSTKSTIATIVLPLPDSGLSETFNINWEAADTLGAKSIQDAVLKTLGGKLKDLLGDPAKYLEYKAGAILNDFPSQAFGGTEFREFSFSFKLLPANLEEAELIVTILNIFKKYSLSKWDKYFIKYPMFWNIGTIFPNSLGSTEFEGVKFKNCVCTSVGCNYFPDSIITIFKSGHPISPEITLSFKELDKVYSDDIEI